MRQSLIKMFVVITAIGFFLSGDFAAAQQNLVIDQTTMTMDVAEIIDILIGILSWGWVLLANLAGKLMTNQFVYGEFINLDSVLFQMWNVAKNFANFGLGFFFIYNVFKYFFSEDDSIGSIGGILSKIIIAAVGIQMSWFLVAAVIDISTVVTTAVSAFPNAILEGSFQDQEQLINSIKQVPSKVTLKTQGGINDRSLEISSEKLKDTDLTSEEYLDFIVPSANDISGPLYYIGFSALRIQDYMTLTLDSPSGEKPVSLMVTTFLKFGILLFFSLALLILVILNIFRIMYLWLFISFVPILILLRAIGKGDTLANAGLSGFDFPEIIKLIFTPAIYIAYLGITLIAIVTMQRVILNSTALNADNCNQNIDGVTMCYDAVEKSSSLNIDALNSGITIDGEIFPPGFQDAAANIFTSMLLSIFTLLMLRGLVGIMANSGTSIGRSTISNITDTAKTVATSIPIVPLAGGQSIASLQAVSGDSLTKIQRSSNQKSRAQVTEFEGKLNRFLGYESGMTATTRGEISDLATAKNDISGNSSAFLNKANAVIASLPEYSLKNSTDNISNDLDTWFVTHKSAIAKISDFKNNVPIQDAFNKSKDVKSISEFVDNIGNKGDKKVFLDWLHKKLGGKGGDMYSWKEFVNVPIKAKKA